MEEELKQGCQWIGPEQEPYLKPVHFCGAKCVPYRSYCAEHVFKVYQEGTQQRRRRATFKQSNVEFWENLFEEALTELEAEGIDS